MIPRWIEVKWETGDAVAAGARPIGSVGRWHTDYFALAVGDAVREIPIGEIAKELLRPAICAEIEWPPNVPLAVAVAFDGAGRELWLQAAANSGRSTISR
jgi:hypothetical protein